MDLGEIEDDPQDLYDVDQNEEEASYSISWDFEKMVFDWFLLLHNHKIVFFVKPIAPDLKEAHQMLCWKSKDLNWVNSFHWQKCVLKSVMFSPFVIKCEGQNIENIK